MVPESYVITLILRHNHLILGTIGDIMASGSGLVNRGYRKKNHKYAKVVCRYNDRRFHPLIQ